MKRTKEDKPLAFIITPIDSDGSVIRRATDGLIDDVIIPVLQHLKFTCNVSHRMDTTGSISQQILEHILNDAIVIANLTGLNPNVMYELAVRHAKAKPAIMIAESRTDVPFDVVTERVIFYKNDMQGAIELRKNLKLAIKNLDLTNKPADNPVYRAGNGVVMRETIARNTPEEYVINQLQEMKAQVNRQSRLLESAVFASPSPSSSVSHQNVYSGGGAAILGGSYKGDTGISAPYYRTMGPTGPTGPPDMLITLPDIESPTGTKGGR
jgi:hypothetical protein